MANNTWNLTDLYHTKDFVPKSLNSTSLELLIFNSDEQFNETDSSLIYYWKAPKIFLKNGNWINSYGSVFTYYVYYVPIDNSASAGYPTTNADLIIEVRF